MRYVITMLATLALASGASAASIVNGTFDDLSPGLLNGQGGWSGTSVSGGSDPIVATAPGTGHGQAVMLAIPDFQGANSYMEQRISNLVGSYSDVVVSFDLYRYTESPQWSSNVWWWWVDSGTPTYGLSWDQGSGTQAIFPFGWDAAGYTAPWWYDNWVNVKMEWNFQTGRAHFWLDGWDPGSAADMAITGITSLSGWGIQLGHDEATGSGPETVWIDNLMITATPEPASLALVALGGLFIARRRKA